MMNINRFKVLVLGIILTIVLFFIKTGYTEEISGQYINDPNVKEFINNMVQKHGFDKKYLESLFEEAKVIKVAKRLMSSPAESRNTWETYRKNMLHEIRVKNGIKFYKNNKKLLEGAEKKYGVPPHIVAGIIGVETNYGKSLIRYRAMDTISTFAFFYPRRSEYFKRELEALLLFSRKIGKSPLEIKSSYAGAIGIPQFMPSNVLTYAVSGTGAKEIDIVNNNSDAIYSVANFIYKKNWNKGQPVALKVRVKGNRYKKFLTGKVCNNKMETVGTLKKNGIIFPRRVPNDLRANLYVVEGKNGQEVHAAFPNFCSVFRYNPSIHYVMGVNVLGHTVAAHAGEPVLVQGRR